MKKTKSATTAGERTQKHTPGYALEALVTQLVRFNEQGSTLIHFDALTDHPETDEDCTFRDLIEAARCELEGLKKQGAPLTKKTMTVELNYGDGQPSDTVKGVDEVEIDKEQVFLRRYGRPGITCDSFDYLCDSVKIKLDGGGE